METLATGWSPPPTTGHGYAPPTTPPPSPAVTTGAAYLYASVADATRSHAWWATPDQIEIRLSDVSLAPLLRSITDGSQSLALVYEQLPLELHAVDRLRASAAGLLAIAATGRQQPLTNHGGHEAAPPGQLIRPVDLLGAAANQILRLNPPALQPGPPTQSVAERGPDRITSPRRHQHPHHPNTDPPGTTRCWPLTEDPP